MQKTVPPLSLQSKAFGLVLFVALLFISPISPARAAGVRYAAPTAQGTGDCSSWANACTLQTALTGAIAGDEIWVMTGVHKPTTISTERAVSFVLKNEVTVYGGFAGTETARDQRDPVANITVLSGDIDGNDTTDAHGIVTDTANIIGNNSYHVVANTDVEPTALLDGVTITAGQANNDDTFNNGMGGGMINTDSSPTLANVAFSGNSAEYFGGGMYNLDASSPTLTDVTFHHNLANDGGAMANLGNGSPTLANVTIYDNEAVNSGGGIYNVTWGNLQLMNVTFYQNVAGFDGGAIWADNSNPVLTNVTFFQNSATNGLGGAIYSHDSNFNIRNAIFSNNPSFNDPLGQISYHYNIGLVDSIVHGLVNDCLESDEFRTSYCTNVLTDDPLLGTFGDYGGATETIPLLPGSPAIGLSSTNCPTTDQRGVARSSLCDSGAFEFSFSTMYAAPTTVGSGDCTTWTDACILKTALALADSGAEIWVKEGIHKPTATVDQTISFVPMDGVGIYGGFAGTETIREARNPTTRVTVLSGDIDNNDNNVDGNYIAETYNDIQGNNSYHVVTANGVSSSTVLDGFTITAGQTPNSGGGIYNENSSQTLTNITFSGNFAGYSGGGIYNHNYSSPILMNVTFNGNYAGNYGGGIHNHQSSPILTNVTLNNNTASFGGGMYNDICGPTLMNVTFSNNTANYGGGMYNHTSGPTLTDVTFSNNLANEDGGGMYNSYYSNPSLTNITFNSNTTNTSNYGYGGGLFNTDHSNPSLTNVTFSNNFTYSGGGMFNSDYSNPALTNVIFSSNMAISSGGGMYNTTRSSPTLTNVTFTNNTANFQGGGMLNFASLTIHNAIFWGNSALNYPQTNHIDTLTNSVVEDGCPSGSTCTNIITDDPLLGTLGDYGGFTATIPLLVGSSAIDAGDDSTCAAADQRGENRDDWACDIGAYEVQFSDSDIASKNVSSGGTYTFGSTLVKVDVVDDAGCLTNLNIQRVELDHPEATDGIKTGRYWQVTSTGCTNNSGFDLTVTLPTDLELTGKDKACRWDTSATQWDCGQDSANSGDSTGPIIMPNIVTRQGVMQLSDWAVGRDVGPTAVTLSQLFIRQKNANNTLWLGLVGLLCLASVALLVVRRKRPF